MDEKELRFLPGIRKFSVLLFLLFSISFVLNSEGMTRKEINGKIKEAEDYFEAQEYDKAITLLTEILENSPERMDQAIAMINKITEIRKEYNKKYKELITALFDDEDPKKALELIEDLEKLEKNPNDVTEKAIRNARISAELVYNKIRLREIMDEAKIKLDSREYPEALALYESGFKLGRQTYEESEIVSDLEKSIVFNTIKELQDGAVIYLGKCQILANDLITMNEGLANFSSSEVSENLSSIFLLFNEISNDRRTYTFKRTLIENNLQVIISYDKNAPERFFLDFSKFLINGRNDVDFYEGIISTVDLYWEDQFISLSNSIDLFAASSYEEGIKEYNNGNFVIANIKFTDAYNYALNSIAIYGLLNKRITVERNYSFESYSMDLIQNYYGKLVDSRIIARVSDSYRKMITLLENQSIYSLEEEQTLEDLYSLRIKIISEIPIVDNEIALWEKISDSLNWLEGYDAKSILSEEISYNVKSELSKISKNMNDMSLGILTRVTDLVYGKIIDEFDKYNSVYISNKSLIEGIIDKEIVEYTGIDNILSSFPDKALPNMEALLVDLASLSEETTEIYNTFSIDNTQISDNEKINTFLEKTELLMPRIRSLIESSGELEAEARDRIFRADSFKNQGDKLLESIRTVIRNTRADREDFDKARENLEDASNAFYQSYTIKENLDLRILVDEEVTALQNELLAIENRLVIADVRNFIDKGKDSYIRRKYGQSRVFLERARNRWFTTNTEENSQIQYWMALVDLALQFDRGRTIAKTEPLYDEMIQFLNLAKSNYNRGAGFYNAGDEENGKKALDSAVENLQHITIYMPQNEDASFLLLKIEQLRDLDAFEESFSIRIDDAWAKLQTTNKTSQGEGYIELLDLSKIDPTYTGLQNKISIAEYDILKTRKRPPDPKDIAESNSLYEQAKTIVEGGVRSQFEIALTWLNQAIVLNPENHPAIEIIDRIHSESGGQATIVLPTALEVRFREAEQEFIQGNVLTAYAIILELKKDRRSAKYPPLLKLEERVKLKL